MANGHSTDLTGILSKIPMGKENRPSWDSYFMLLAKLAASRSTCLSRPTGAVIVKDKRVLATGYNGALAGRIDCLSEGACYRRANKIQEGKKEEYKGCRSEHAERNAIDYAAGEGIAVKGSTMYVTLHPCKNCTKSIISAKIIEVVYEKEYDSGNKERDEEWKKFPGKDIIVRQHKVSEKEIEYILSFLTEETSRRRLPPTN